MARVALVTGAGQGVGRGVAEVLAASGFVVLVNDLHRDRAEETVRGLRDAGGEAVAAPFDVTVRPEIDEALASLVPQIGPVDILVNNAGVPEAYEPAPLLSSDPERWMSPVALNLFGSMHCIQAVGPGMVERGWGRIVQISSGTASFGRNIGVSLYAGSKAAIEGVIRHLAAEIGSSGVTANALALGLMENAATSPAAADIGIERLVADVPLQRFGKMREVGAAVRWLVSEDAGFVTGQVIHLNGGQLNGR